MWENAHTGEIYPRLKATQTYDIAIIVLNWNRWKDTIECLESLEKAIISKYHLIIVDNNSDDDSVQRIKQWIRAKHGLDPNFLLYPACESNDFTCKKPTRNGPESPRYLERITVIKNVRNYGFAEGNNIAIRYALRSFNPKYFLLLNNDVVVDTNFAKELLMLIETDSRIGIVGAANYYYCDPKRIQVSGGTINWFNGKKTDLTENKVNCGQYTGKREVDYVPGSCFLLRREVLDKIGLFAKEFFFYYEEIDFCVRAKRKGFRILVSLDAKIWHKVSSSAGKDSDFTLFYLIRNWFVFMKKNATEIQYTIFLVSFFAFDFVKISGAILLWRRNPKRYTVFIKAILDGLRLKIPPR